MLVDDRLECKIADFGLSRRALEVDQMEYAGNEGSKIPIRWSAPEAITSHKYTGKVLGNYRLHKRIALSASSDVWSFGIVMWEVCSFGEIPYMDWPNRRVIEEVAKEDGYRLPCPADAPVPLHNVSHVISLLSFSLTSQPSDDAPLLAVPSTSTTNLRDDRPRAERVRQGVPIARQERVQSDC